ncbi:hypothetical protein [Hydrogenobacter thermophilus]|uniref:hypothetical protein n=1 Tax=Hydrogenobacter thermophilus TaxID=940 RepID=UPI0030F8549E
MIKIETKGNRALSFVLGLIYGYRGANFELSIKDIGSFSEEAHREDKVYYINRLSGEVNDKPCDEVTHICVIKEDNVNKKVLLYIYKSVVKLTS